MNNMWPVSWNMKLRLPPAEPKEEYHQALKWANRIRPRFLPGAVLTLWYLLLFFQVQTDLYRQGFDRALFRRVRSPFLPSFDPEQVSKAHGVDCPRNKC